MELFDKKLLSTLASETRSLQREYPNQSQATVVVIDRLNKLISTQEKTNELLNKVVEGLAGDVKNNERQNKAKPKTENKKVAPKTEAKKEEKKEVGK